MLSRQRSGTTMLRQVMNHHSDIYIYPEVFLANGQFWSFLREEDRSLPSQSVISRDEIDSLLDDFLSYLSSKAPKASVIAIDVKYDQLNIVPSPASGSLLPSILSMALRRRWPILHVVRENHLQVLLSNELARVNTFTGYTQAHKKRSTEIRCDNLLARLEKMEQSVCHARGLLKEFQLQSVEACYEHFALGTMPEKLKEYQKITDFFKFSALSEIHEKTIKVSPPLSEGIDNYDDVCSCLNGSQFESLLTQ
jgi:hypothetical protein